MNFVVFSLFLIAVRRYDPDILVGFEIQKQSWCYLVKRAIRLDLFDFYIQISRLPKSNRDSCIRLAKRLIWTINNNDNKGLSKEQKEKEIKELQAKQILSSTPIELVCGGRAVFNLWRLLRSELSLGIYTFENCCYHILKERTAKHSYSTLTTWKQSDLTRERVVEYYAYRAHTNLRLIKKIGIIGKASEFARVFGIEFYHVLSRGTQYRVESMMLRVSRALNYVALSCSQKSKSAMRAAECIPLTLEPESRVYHERSIAVLDFQSLYPSCVIAYNICFTTCLGRIELIGKEGCFKFGCSSLFLPDTLLRQLDLNRDIFIAPNGVGFVKCHIRKGILPILLEDLLSTRIMVKTSMKLHKTDEELLSILDSRQLSLKLIANVTFGYTAANFSGRMPCVEVGDTIVRVARRCLEESIKHVHSLDQERVVYGDTDSLFVLFNKSIPRDIAFDRSFQMVKEITNFFPKPIILKFEKIYCKYLFENN
jgi:DNA polymerase zeta